MAFKMNFYESINFHNTKGFWTSIGYRELINLVASEKSKNKKNAITRKKPPHIK